MKRLPIPSLDTDTEIGLGYILKYVIVEEILIQQKALKLGHYN